MTNVGKGLKKHKYIPNSLYDCADIGRRAKAQYSASRLTDEDSIIDK